MKLSIKTDAIALLAILGISSIALRSEAACNPPQGGSAAEVEMDGPSIVSVGDSVSYGAWHGVADTVSGDWSWTYTGFIVDGSDTEMGIDLTAPSTPSSSVDDKSIKATFTPYTEGWSGSCSETINVTVVGVKKIQYMNNGTWQDAPDPLYVLKGSTVDFKAIKDPNDATSWPSGKPVWGGVASGSDSDTESVTFNTVSSVTVTAECGNDKGVNVVVFDLTGTLTPDDNFANRSQSRYGLEETVGLAFTTDPTGVTAAQAGGLEWTKHSGNGAVSSAGNDGTADYDAQHTAGAVELRLTIKSGPSTDQFKSYARTVVVPSGSYMTKKTGSGIRHTINSCSAGFLGWSYLLPKDVSFSNLSRREGTCVGTGTGFYLPSNGDVHRLGSWFPVSTGNSVRGCRVLVDDQIYTEAYGSYAIGQFDWPIPRTYKADDGVPHDFTIALHRQVSDSAGKCTIQKHGSAPYSKNAADPTSSW